MKYKTLDDFNFKGKVVLLRADLNSPIERGKVVMNSRLIESKKTISELKRKGAKVVVLAHQSRPGKKDFRGMKEHAKLLGVRFVEDVIGGKAVRAISGLDNGDVILLDNVRKVRDEFNPSKKGNRLLKVLGGLGEIYINDAFSVSHREQTSIIGFPNIMDSGVGRLMQYEIENLEKLKLKDCLFILGGAKVKENLLIMKKHKNVMTCGLFGQLCLIAGGKDLGAQNKFLKKEFKYLGDLKKSFSGSCLRPLDLAVREKGKRKEYDLDEFPKPYLVYDIGSETVRIFVSRIEKAKCVFMKGTAGYCEEREFCKGTREIFRAISKVKGFTVIGGGHSSNALEKMGISKKKFGYVSLSGGALAKFVAGERLVGLEVLGKGRLVFRRKRR